MVVAHPRPSGPYRAPGDPALSEVDSRLRFPLSITSDMATGIKVHVAGNVFEGTVFAIDPVTKSIVLSE